MYIQYVWGGFGNLSESQRAQREEGNVRITEGAEDAENTEIRGILCMYTCIRVETRQDPLPSVFLCVLCDSDNSHTHPVSIGYLLFPSLYSRLIYRHNKI